MQNGAQRWATVVWVTLLGLWATLPIGIIIGSLAPSVQKVGTWGMFPVLVLVGISGIFFPIQDLWGWVQTVSQMFPMYWVGLGIRRRFPRCGRGPGDRRLVANRGDGAGPLRMGGGGDPDRPGRGAPDGPPPVGLASPGRQEQALQWSMTEALPIASPCSGQSGACPVASSARRLGSTIRQSAIWSGGVQPEPVPCAEDRRVFRGPDRGHLLHRAFRRIGVNAR